MSDDQESLHRLLIAIDGPAGAGKSSVARRVAARLGYAYVDTGAMYRAVTLACLRRRVRLDPMDAAAVGEVVAAVRIEMTRTGGIALDGEVVDERLRDEDVTSQVSPVSALAVVRQAMVGLQRQVALDLARQGIGVVMDGRDIGSNVFPRAGHRFYLDASIEERARRRREQMRARGKEVVEDLDHWMERIRSRDAFDSGRDLAPLVVAEGAQVLDSTDLDEDAVVAEILRRVRPR